MTRPPTGLVFFSLFLIFILLSLPSTRSETTYTTTPVRDNFGCLAPPNSLHNGAQNPPALNFLHPFPSKQSCDPVGTSFFNFVTFQCVCRIGYSGQRCDFSIAGFEIGITLIAQTLQPALMYGQQYTLSLKYAPTARPFRFSWAYTDSRTGKYIQIDFRASKQIVQGDSEAYFANGLFYFPTDLPTEDNTYIGTQQKYLINTPPADLIPNGSNCLTLVAAEIENDQINDENPTPVLLSPIAEMAILTPNEANGVLPAITPLNDDCVAAGYSTLFFDAVSRQFRCGCPDRNKFGRNCQHQIWTSLFDLSYGTSIPSLVLPAHMSLKSFFSSKITMADDTIPVSITINAGSTQSTFPFSLTSPRVFEIPSGQRFVDGMTDPSSLVIDSSSVSFDILLRDPSSAVETTINTFYGVVVIEEECLHFNKYATPRVQTNCNEGWTSKCTIVGNNDDYNCKCDADYHAGKDCDLVVEYTQELSPNYAWYPFSLTSIGPKVSKFSTTLQAAASGSKFLFRIKYPTDKYQPSYFKNLVLSTTKSSLEYPPVVIENGYVYYNPAQFDYDETTVVTLSFRFDSNYEFSFDFVSYSDCVDQNIIFSTLPGEGVGIQGCSTGGAILCKTNYVGQYCQYNIGSPHYSVTQPGFTQPFMGSTVQFPFQFTDTNFLQRVEAVSAGGTISLQSHLMINGPTSTVSPPAKETYPSLFKRTYLRYQHPGLYNTRFLTFEQFADCTSVLNNWSHALPKCIAANTRICQNDVSGFLTNSIPYCICKDNFTGPQCQTRINDITFDGNTVVITISSPNSYDKPHSVRTSNAVNFSFEQTGQAVLDSAYTSLAWQLSFVYPSGIVVPIPFDQTKYVQVPNTFREVQINYDLKFRSNCLGGYKNIIDPEDHGECTCPNSMFGPNCEYYLQYDDSIQNWNTGDIFSLDIASIAPIPFSFEQVLITVQDLNSDIVQKHYLYGKNHIEFPVPILQWNGVKNRQTSMIITVSLTSQDIVFVQSLLFPVSDNSCDIVNTKFGTTCTSPQYCNPFATNAAEACSECLPWFFTTDLTAPCASYVFFEDIASIQQTNELIPETNNILWPNKRNRFVQLAPGLSDDDIIIEASVIASPSDKMTFGLNVPSTYPAALNFQPMDIFKQVELTISIQYNSQTYLINKVNAILINTDRPCRYLDLIPTAPVCNPANTISCSLSDFELAPECECQSGWYGRFCDLQIVSNLPTSLTTVTQIKQETTYYFEFYWDKYTKPGLIYAPRQASNSVVIQLSTTGEILNNGNSLIPYQPFLYPYFFPDGSSDLILSFYIGTSFGTSGPEVKWGTFSSRTVQGVSSCNPTGTEIVLVTDNCICKPNYIGNTCQTLFSATLINFSTFPADINYVDDHTYYPGQTVTIQLTSGALADNIPISFWSSDSFPTIPTSIRMDLDQITLELPTGTLQYSLTPSSTRYNLNFAHDVTMVSPCEWYSTHASPSTTTCYGPYTDMCPFSTTTAIENRCECKQIHIDDDFITTYTGIYCQVRVRVPNRPLYHKQKLKLDIFVEPSSGLSPNWDFSSWVWESTTGLEALSATIINDPIYPDDWYIQVPDTGVDLLHLNEFTPRGNVVNQWVLKYQPLDQKNFEIGPLRIVEPCYWMTLAGYQYQCINSILSSTDDAHSGCINPNTFEIECQCNTGFNFPDCSLYTSIETDGVVDSSGHVSLFDGSVGTLSVTLFGKKSDVGRLSSPQMLPIYWSAVENGAFSTINSQYWNRLNLQQLSLTHNAPILVPNYDFGKYFLPQHPDYRVTEGYLYPQSIYIPSGAKYNINSFLQKPLSIDYISSSNLSPEPTFANPGIIPFTPIESAINIRDGLICPYGYKGSGCRCNIEGVFAPDCSWKLEMKPVDIWFGQPQVTFSSLAAIINTQLPIQFTLRKIGTNMKSSLGKEWNLPNKWHLEFVSPKPAFFTPYSDLENTYIISLDKTTVGDMYLVSDDVSVPGKFHIALTRNLSVCEGPNVIGFTRLPADTTPPNNCLCKPGYYTENCSKSIPVPPPEPDTKMPWYIYISSGSLLDPITLLTAPPGSLDQIDRAWIRAINSRAIIQGGPVQQELTVDKVNGKLITKTPLLDFDQKSSITQYKVIIQDIGQGTTSELSYPITLQIPCNLDSCPTTIDITFPTAPSGSPSPLVTNLEFISKSLLTDHEKTTPGLIIPLQTKSQITFPAVETVSGDLVIKLGYYPQAGPNSYLSTPTWISTKTVPSQTTAQTVQFDIPVGIVATKMFYQVTFIDSSSPVVHVTPVFTILPNCFSPPDSIQFVGDKQKWSNLCQNGGICSTLDQTCSCPDDFGGEFCTDVTNPCPHCNSLHTQSCTPNTCQCETTWGGAFCDLPQSCVDQSEKSCMKNNGQLIVADGKCTKECECFNKWVGKSCELCSLQCQNGGLAYKSCDRCGCSAGFSGESCQCKSSQGNIVINGFNEVLIHYDGLLKTVPDLLKLPDYYELIKFIQTMQRDISGVLTALLELSPNSLNLSFEPITSSTEQGDLKTTKFHVSIVYSCDGMNQELTLDLLKKRWELMSTGLSENSIILRYFTFNPGPIIVDVDDLTPTDPTLPSDDDKLEGNGVVKLNTIAIIVFIVVVVLCVYY